MKAFLETTVYEEGREYPHVYWMDDGKNKAYAYARWGNPNDVKVFSKPMMIDVRGRKFEPVRNIFGFVDPAATGNKTWTVEGSKGNKYTVEQTDEGLTCTCSGFKFRGECRHLKEVEAA